MIVDNYDFNISAIDNYTPIILAEAGFFNKEAKKQEQLILRMGQDENGLVKSFETLPYIRNEFGDRKPICLLAKLLREIKRIIKDILNFVGDILTSIDDWLDDNLPGWDALSGFVKDAIIDPIMDVLNSAWNAIEDAWNDVVDFVRDIGGC